MVSKYSVLMSVYYKEKPEYLKQAIESIQAQTLQTDDFVLVCDGPLNDALDKVIATKQQEMGEKLNVVRLAKNGGLGNALNKGIKHCKNELVARMDSDDIAYLDRCEKQMAVFNTHSEVSICSGIVEEFTSDPKIVDTKRVPPETNAEIVEFAKKRHASVMVRGLRAVTDFENEIQLAQTNHALMPGIETMFLATSIKWSYLSSTIVKEAARYGSSISKFVTPNVEAAVEQKMAELRSRGENV